MKGWRQIVIAVGSALLAFFLVLLIFSLWKIQSTRKRKKKLELQKTKQKFLDPKEHQFMPRLSISPYKEGSCIQLESKNRKISPKPQFPHLEILKCQDQYDSSQSSSEEETESVPKSKPYTEWLEIENNSPELPVRSRDTSVIEFSLVYVSSNKTLTVHIIRVANLPLRYRKNCSSFVKVSLLARKKSSHQTQVFKKSLNPEYVQNFTFPGYSLEEIKRFTLRLSVFVKHYRLLKDKLVGEIWFPLSSCDLQADVPAIITENLSTSRSSKQKRSSTTELGQLFLLIQYQSNANRLKVLVRKAENLPGPKGVSIGQPEYYVIVSLLRDIEGITYKETRPSTGVSPVWNQPFLFDIPFHKIEEYWLQFLVMRGRIYSRDGVVGHVMVGAGTTPTGEAHWNEAMEPKALDTAKWHKIQPIDDF